VECDNALSQPSKLYCVCSARTVFQVLNPASYIALTVSFLYIGSNQFGFATGTTPLLIVQSFRFLPRVFDNGITKHIVFAPLVGLLAFSKREAMATCLLRFEIILVLP
jgi:hypothetical protein